jgi:Fe-S cluster assembly ATP-binding protein
MSSDAFFEVNDLRANVEGTAILKGLNLTIGRGEVHALMGPNGSGKSTLSNVVMGHPGYEVTGGEVRLGGEALLEMAPEERARAGLFLAFQYPVEIPGVTVANFLKTAHDATAGENKMSTTEFLKGLRRNMELLEIESSFVNRYLNSGFSGGEKKRMEILQMLMLNPKMVIMDETDSGLDIDALKVVSRGVNAMTTEDFGLLIITHYERILTYIKPTHLHILIDGQIVVSGGPNLVKDLEEHGYDWVREHHANESLAAV